MTKPIIAANRPIAVDLEARKDYYFCTCGRSSKQPFCDGTHKQFADSQVGSEGPGTNQG